MSAEEGLASGFDRRLPHHLDDVFESGKLEKLVMLYVDCPQAGLICDGRRGGRPLGYHQSEEAAALFLVVDNHIKRCIVSFDLALHSSERFKVANDRDANSADKERRLLECKAVHPGISYGSTRHSG
ncbi:hypothetical protein [Rhizobium leguminosarum]